MADHAGLTGLNQTASKGEKRLQYACDAGFLSNTRNLDEEDSTTYQVVLTPMAATRI
ncbi:hypothetical protein CCACVL1_29564, partial [Corchorus capsularis]